MHLLHYALLVIAVATPTYAQAPANDDCANAQAAVLGLNPYDSTMATDSGVLLDPLVCNLVFDEIFQDVWFTFTPAETEHYWLETMNNGNPSMDTKIAVYDNTGCPPQGADVIACDDDSGAGLQSWVGVDLTVGVTYLIRVGSFDQDTDEEPGALSIIVAPPFIVNDYCVNATVASVGSNLYDSANTSTDGLALDPMVCDLSIGADEQIYNDVWFDFTAPTTDSYEFDTSTVMGGGGTTFDTRIAVYDSTACPDDPALVIGCNDDQQGPPSNTMGRVTVNLVSGQSVKVRVGSFISTPGFGDAGDLFITTTPPPPVVPPNDECANHIAVGLGQTPFDTRGATDGTNFGLDPMVCDMGVFGDEQIYQDVWYSFTPTTTGFFNVSTVGNGHPPFDSRLAIYNQVSCPAFPAWVIGCDDDSGSGAGFEAAILGVPMNAGQDYLIRLGSFDANTSEHPALLDISVGSPPPAAPPNDLCANAQSIVGFGTYAFDSANATTDGSNLTGFCDFSPFGDDRVHHDVWYEFTPTFTGCTYISTLNLAGFDTRMAIYGSTTCPDDPAAVIACTDEEIHDPITPPFEAGFDVDVIAGNKYLLRVGDFSAGSPGGMGMFVIAQGSGAAANDQGMQLGAPGCAPGPQYAEFCHGDGGDQLGCTDCPCNNNASPGTRGGCVNSSGNSARLIGSGDASVSLPAGSTTDLRFELTGAPPTSFCILNSGAAIGPGNPANPCFGMNSGAQAMAFDGLRCAIQGTQRHGGRSADNNGDVGMTNNGWGGQSGPPAGLASAFGVAYQAGQTRYWQVINREEPAAICMRGLNTSQAVEVTFEP